MARKEFAIEQGIEILALDADPGSGVRLIKGTGAPGGDAGQQDDAPIGSIYIRQNGASSTLYQKIANAGASGDWQENGSSTVAIGTWRGENVVAVTNDTVTAGVARDLVASPFADDEGTTLAAADFQVGDFIIADADGTPVLLEVTNVSAPNVTFSTPASAPALAQDDTFVARNYLPDSPAGQEGQAIAHYNGSIIVKLGDVDWDFATGINMSSGYTPGSGDPSSADTVESAIEKLDGNNDAQDSAIGISQGDTNMGTYTGALLNDNESAKQNIQQLETEAEAMRTTSGTSAGDLNYGAFTGDLLADNQSGKQLFQRLEDLLDELKSVEVTGITTQTAVDSVPVASYVSCKWIVEAFEEATPANVQAFEVYALHDGTNTDETVYAKLKLGANFNLVINTDVNAGNLRLLATSSTAGVTVRARRIGVMDL